MRTQVIDTIEVQLTPSARRELYLLLALLRSRPGSLLLLGRASFGGGGGLLPMAFTRLPLRQREAVLLAWSTSGDAKLSKVGLDDELQESDSTGFKSS